MEFRISCVRGNDKNNKPCDGAYLKPEPDSYDGYAWLINIGTIEDLLKLYDRLGWSLIVSNTDDRPAIEIYDAYRE